MSFFGFYPPHFTYVVKLAMGFYSVSFIISRQQKKCVLDLEPRHLKLAFIGARRSRVRHHKLVDLRCIRLWEKRNVDKKLRIQRHKWPTTISDEPGTRMSNGPLCWALAMGVSRLRRNSRNYDQRSVSHERSGVSYPIKHHNDDWFLNLFLSILAQQRAKIIRQFAQVGAADCDWPVWLCPAARPTGGVLHAKAASTVHDV